MESDEGREGVKAPDIINCLVGSLSDREVVCSAAGSQDII